MEADDKEKEVFEHAEEVEKASIPPVKVEDANAVETDASLAQEGSEKRDGADEQ